MVLPAAQGVNCHALRRSSPSPALLGTDPTAHSERITVRESLALQCGQKARPVSTIDPNPDKNSSDATHAASAIERMEAALRESEARYKQTIESSHDAVVSMDSSGLIITWNRSAERMFGWKAEEVLGHRLSDVIIPHAMREKHEAGLKRYLKEGTGNVVNNRVEVAALHRNGLEIAVELSIWPVRTGSQVIFGSFIRDISRRRANELALRRSEERYRMVIENVAEGILVVQDGLIAFANPRTERMVGRTLDQMRAQHFAMLIHPDDRALVADRYSRRLRGEQIESYYSFRVLNANGDVMWVELSAVMIEWEGAPATLSFITDITQRRELQEQLKASLAEQMELNQLKSRFVSMTSHEFRTPLTAILSSMELIKHYHHKLSDTERASLIKSVEDAVSHMTKMLDDVLLIGKADAGRLEFRPEPVQLDAFSRRMADAARAVAEVGGRGLHQIEFVPSGTEQLVMLDIRLLQHVLENLLSNAIKYSPAGGTVRFHVSCPQDRIEFMVEDRGIGLPAKDLPRLFESFFRASNVGNISGTGLGLSIVKRSVDLHGGTIRVHSEVGQGTRFTVELPRVSAT